MMRRTPMARSIKPMKRSAIRVKVADTISVNVRRPLKTTRPKMTPIRLSAKGKDCTFRIPGICNWNPETTVWCHSNESVDGKGAGLKARDVEGAYGCSACHAYYDGGYANLGIDRDTARAQFNIARDRSRPILKMEGLI